MMTGRVDVTSEDVVLDTMCLMHYALADRLDVLGDLLTGFNCYSTGIVRDELTKKSQAPGKERIMAALSLPWLEFDPLSDLENLLRFAKWKELLGADEFNLGEASVFAVAETRDSIAITDDQDAVRVGRSNGLKIHGNLWVLAKSCREGKIATAGAATIVDLLKGCGLRLPCSGATFESWAKNNQLL